MARQNDLFELVKSLSKAEKAFFRKNLPEQDRGPSSYLKLFDALDAMKEYDETALLKKLKITRQGTAFSVSKNYLYKAVLKSLVQFNAEKSSHAVIQHHLLQGEVLNQKGLYEQARKSYEKALQAATEADYPSLAYECQTQLRGLFSYLPITAETTEELQKLNAAMEDMLQNLQSENSLTAISKMQFVLLKQLSFEGVRSEHHKLLLEQLLEHPHFTEENCKTFTARCLYYTVLGHHYYALGDMKSSFEWRKKAVDYMEGEGERLRTHRMRYYSTLNTFLNICLRMHRFDIYQKYIAALRDYHQLEPGMASRVFLMYANLEMNYCFGMADLSYGKKMLPGIVSGLQTYRPLLSVNFLMPIHFNTGSLLYMLQRYDEALDYFKFCSEQKVDENMAAVSRVVLLILHYELKNYDLISYLIRNTERYFKKQGRLFEFEKAFLTRMKAILALAHKNEKQKEFSMLYSDLERLKTNRHEMNAIGIFDFTGWLKKHSGEKISA